MRVHVCLFALLLASGAAAQTPPRDASRSGAAMTAATISGRITDAETGAPIAEASVMVVARSDVLTIRSQRSYQGWTGADGRFVLSDIAPGAYVVAAGPPEHTASHLPRAFGAALPFITGTRGLGAGLDLAAGDVRSDIDLALVRARAIEGRVVNEFGEPLASVTVLAVGADGRTGGLGGGFVTDDRGVFRVFGLPPGSYRVCAAPEPRAPMIAGAATLDMRLVRTCHPAAIVESSAEVIAIGAADATGVLIQMQRAGTFTISGRVVDESGALATDAHVSVLRVGTNVAVETRSGTFVARGLTPGDYVVHATANHSSGAREPAAGREGSHTIRLESGDVTGLDVRVSQGATLRGRVVAEGGALPRGRLVVQMRRPFGAQRLFDLRTVAAVVKDDRTFEVRRLFGPLILELTGLPDGWVVSRVRYRGEDVTDLPTEFADTNDARAMEVVVTNRSARLSVRVVDEHGRDAVGQVLLLPADAARWNGGLQGREGIMAGPETRGALRPGEYLVAAVAAEDMIGGLYEDSFASRVARVAQRITLAAGEHRTVDVRLMALPGGR